MWELGDRGHLVQRGSLGWFGFGFGFGFGFFFVGFSYFLFYCQFLFFSGEYLTGSTLCKHY
jgi:hypothetical protein